MRGSRPAFVAVLFALLLVVPAASSAVVAPGSGLDAVGERQTNQTSTPPDPGEDVLGWEGGYWHNESIAVDQSDGLNDSELDAYVSRAMARVEELRQREFTADVPVAVESRAEYRARTNNRSSNESHAAWNNQVWEALFVVGENTDAMSELDAAYGSSVAGFYSPADERITVVTSGDDVVIDNATLVHELVHALQDQHHDLDGETYAADTKDGELAVDGVVEGEANYVERLYAQRCDESWDCVDSPPGGPGSVGDVNYALLLTILQPYSDGPPYVASLHEAGGWDAVDRKLRHPPNSTEQVIHHTEEAPEPITVETTPRDGWERFPEQGVDGAETVGEASIYVMFWDQSTSLGERIVDPQAFLRTDGPFDLYDYAAAPSTGWANDRLVPYHDDGRYGYVWTTEWDTEADAREFHDAYLRGLTARDTTERGPRTYVVEGGPFADAFHVVRNGTTVTIVNAPTVADLRDVHPEIRMELSNGTANGTTTGAETTGADATVGETTTVTGTETTTDGGTGVLGSEGVPAPALVVTLLAVVAAVILAAARRE